MTEQATYGTTGGLSARNFARIAQLVTRELGILMPEAKRTLVESRLLPRARALGLRSVDEYGEYLFDSGDAEEREFLLNAITTNKTDFFREPEHFDYLIRSALPSLRPEGSRPATVRIWSAGCSTGQEPYTLAMVLSEGLSGRRGMDFAILATDVSTSVLEHARLGIYPEAQIAPAPAEMRRKYLSWSRDRQDRRVRIVPALRSKVSFHPLNFMAEDYRIRSLFDAIFFRNVMIYFDRRTAQRVLEKICRYLVPGGYLFIGHSESLHGLDLPVRPVGSAIFRKSE